MKIVIIDNYDSFTYNLSHLIKSLGAEVSVVRNDQFSLDEIEAYSKIVLSPGPGIPSEAGLLLDVIRTYAGRKPILGVCLGHQAIGEAFGGRLENLSDVFHGVATPCHITVDDPIFSGIDRDITIGPARLPGNDGRERRGSDHGAAPPRAERAGHTVPSGERADTRRQKDAAKLVVLMTSKGFRTTK